MYHLVNKEGNVHRLVPSKVKADELVDQGYSYAEAPKSTKEPKAPKSPKESGKPAGDAE